MKNARLLAVCTGIAALTVVVPPAGAGDAVAFTDNGPVSVGDVVGAGTTVGDACVFSSPVQVAVTQAGVTLGLTITRRCDVVVSSLSVGGNGVRAPRGAFLPATEEGAAPEVGAGPAGGVGAPAGLGLNGTKADPVSPRLGMVSQTIYDAAGMWQFEDDYDLRFNRNLRTGSLSATHVYDGYCSANSIGLGVTNEVRSCYVSLPQKSTSTVELRAGGVYRQLLLTTETMRLRLAEKFVAIRDTNGDITDDFTYTCGISEGTIPFGWVSECYGDEVETLAEL